jgi:hypothetical protein
VAVVIIVSLSVGLARKSAMPYSCKDEGGASYDATFFVVSAVQCVAAAVHLSCFCGALADLDQQCAVCRAARPRYR